MNEIASPPEARTKWKIGKGGPINVFGAKVSESDPDCWFRLPSWRVEIEHEAVAGIDLRVHKCIQASNTWDISEATTGFCVYRGWQGDCDTAEAVIDLFCAVSLPKLTAEKFAAAMVKANEELCRRPPCPFPR